MRGYCSETSIRTQHSPETNDRRFFDASPQFTADAVKAKLVDKIDHRAAGDEPAALELRFFLFIMTALTAVIKSMRVRAAEDS